MGLLAVEGKAKALPGATIPKEGKLIHLVILYCFCKVIQQQILCAIVFSQILWLDPLAKCLFYMYSWAKDEVSPKDNGKKGTGWDREIQK